MASPRVLLLGGHGKVSLLMTPLFLSRSWNVTSVVRNADHRAEIEATGTGHPGKVSVLVRSLDDVKSDSDAQSVLDEVKPDYVVWSAGAGGKGGAARTYAIDKDACIHFIRTSLATPSIKKFLLVSYLGSRRNRPGWWNDAGWASTQKTNREILPHYYAAKLASDEVLTALAHKRAEKGDKEFQSILLRPGALSDEAPTGKVALGKTDARGSVSRGDVAAVAARLLERPDTRGWFDLLEGEEPVESAVERVVKEKVDCVEGEDLEKLYSVA
ncbi:MAG: hypothetical protein M1819_006243 [Sarea resinae]|nr:MAG: hypothetical protein M1819_006243 [Sarea resinae]